MHIVQKKYFIVAVIALIAVALGFMLFRETRDGALHTAANPTFSLTSYLAVEEVAEIVATTPDGMTLVYTNAQAGKIGVIDISELSTPRLLTSIDVKQGGIGEPTSVAISQDGAYALVAVRMADDATHANPGLIRVYDISQPSGIKHVKDIAVGIGPDSLALIGSTQTLRAVVAIEDEETDTEGDATLGGKRPGRIDVVGLQDLYGGTSTGVQTLDLVEAAKQAGINFPSDPQPEFVAIEPTAMKAAVSLQENNAIAIVDLSNATAPKLSAVFSTGEVMRKASADLQKNADIAFEESFTGRREADAITWLSSDVIALANEGDTKKSADGVYPGGRGVTFMDVQGKVVYETGAESEQRAALYGHYPDHRSADKGVEMEAVTTGVFAGSRLLIAASERGSFVEVYNIDDVKKPKFVQLLPTGTSPEGVVTITGRKDGRQLFATGNEIDGSITLFEYHPKGATPLATEPRLLAKDKSITWSALSGLTTDGNSIFAVPDDALSQSRILKINPVVNHQGNMMIETMTPLSLSDGTPLRADIEGIAKVAGGFWLAVEGKTVAENELIKVTEAGVVTERVTLPPELRSRFADPAMATGFEGVAASSDGGKLYVALQRGYDTTKPFAAVLSYDTAEKTWVSAAYPLDTHSKDAEQYWTGLSEIQVSADGRLLLIERDKGGGKAKAVNAEIKRVYSVRLSELTEGATLKKELVRDLRKDFNYLHEKAEGLVVFKGDVWVVNDNDGAGWTRMLNTGKL